MLNYTKERTLNRCTQWKMKSYFQLKGAPECGRIWQIRVGTMFQSLRVRVSCGATRVDSRRRQRFPRLDTLYRNWSKDHVGTSPNLNTTPSAGNTNTRRWFYHYTWKWSQFDWMLSAIKPWLLISLSLGGVVSNTVYCKIRSNTFLVRVSETSMAEMMKGKVG